MDCNRENRRTGSDGSAAMRANVNIFRRPRPHWIEVHAGPTVQLDGPVASGSSSQAITDGWVGVVHHEQAPEAQFPVVPKKSSTAAASSMNGIPFGPSFPCFPSTKSHLEIGIPKPSERIIALSIDGSTIVQLVRSQVRVV
jgi:hypothetical protein